MAVSVPVREDRRVAASRSAPVVPEAQRDWRSTIFKRTTVGVVVALGLIWLIPVAWTIDTSVKTENDTIIIPATWKIPHLTFSSFSSVFSATDLGRWYLNSVIVVVIVTALTVFTDRLCPVERPVPWPAAAVRPHPGRHHDPAPGPHRPAVP